MISRCSRPHWWSLFHPSQSAYLLVSVCDPLQLSLTTVCTCTRTLLLSLRTYKYVAKNVAKEEHYYFVKINDSVHVWPGFETTFEKQKLDVSANRKSRSFTVMRSWKPTTNIEIPDPKNKSYMLRDKTAKNSYSGYKILSPTRTSRLKGGRMWDPM